jgi:CO/xanthine dehydrogenase Mo-binding subunit
VPGPAAIANAVADALAASDVDVTETPIRAEGLARRLQTI